MALDGVPRADIVTDCESVPAEIARLAPRMRQIAEIVYRTGGVTLRDIHREIDDDVTIYGIRTLLSRMARKGLVRRRRSGRHAEIVYLPGILTPQVRAAALAEMVKREFEGSPKAALIVAMRLAQQNARNRD